MSNSPKWVTPSRKAILVKLFLDSGGFCVYGHANCAIPEHHYSVYIEYLIDDWQAEDRAQARLDWLTERKAMHSLGERPTTRQGRFNAISQDIFFGNQPLYYLEALGIDGLKLKPFAKIRIASSYYHLYIDLGNTLRGTSKNQRRKAIRYGKQLPESIQNRVSRLIWLAVRDYLNH